MAVKLISLCCRQFRKFLREDQGMAAIEAALLFPILIGLILASVDGFNYFRTTRVLAMTADAAASVLSDAAAPLSTAEMDDAFRFASLGSTVQLDQNLTVLAFDAANGEIFEHSQGAFCSRPDIESTIDPFLENDGGAIVVSACVWWTPVFFKPEFLSWWVQFSNGQILIQQSAVRRAANNLSCSDCS